MRVFYAVALATTDKRAGIRVPPPWGTLPAPIWTPPALNENLRDNVQPTDLVARAAYVSRNVGVVKTQ